MTRVGIFLIVVVFLFTVALVAGMAGHVSPSLNLEIRTWYDLNAIRDKPGDSYLLMNDLDYTTPGYQELASETANQGRGWQPIGAFINQQVGHGVLGFTGTFKGQGYEVRDLFINRPDEAFVGLFVIVDEGGCIEDIGVVNATVTGGEFVGSLVGFNREMGTVSNSYSTGSVTGRGHSGGLMGWNSGTVSNCCASGSVSGNYSVGGLMGGNSGTVSDCYASGSVSGNYTVGGLVGEENQGTMSDSYCTANVTGYSYVGGLAGQNLGYHEGTVRNCYATGSVTGNSSVGGLMGLNELTTVTNSFWDIQTSGQATSAGGTGRNTTEMKTTATFSGVAWNIIAVALNETNPAYIWNIVDDETYPFLSWQPAA
jgi:hypothetical protein